MKLILLFLFVPFVFSAQEIRKENLTKKRRFYYDAKQDKLESEGCYYTNPLGETTEKHGKWSYYSPEGYLQEERTYFRGKLFGPVITFYSNGKKSKEGYFLWDKADSVYREWNETGKLAMEGFYKEGNPVNNWQYWYISGRKKMDEEIVGGVSYVRQFWYDDSLHTQGVKDGNGTMVTYFLTGGEKEYYTYKDGLKDGIFEEFSPYGYKLIDGKYSEGNKDSTWNFYYYTGKIEKTSNYKNDVLNGPYVNYYDNGKVSVEGTYENGKKTGKWSWYTNRGVLDQTGYFKDDEQHGKWTFNYPTGELSYLAEFNMGKKTGTWTYFYKDQTKFKQGTFKNDEKNGKWETWYEDGTLLMTGDYLNGKEDGLWKNYWENGKLKNEATFVNGQLNGPWKSFYTDGKPKMSCEYKDNLVVGTYIEYFENGKPSDIGEYKIVKIKSKLDYGPMKDHEVKESVKDGKWTSYSQKDNKKTEEGEYKNGQKDGPWISYYPGGRNASNVNTYKDGKLHGTSYMYDRRGNIVSDCEYKDGLKHGKMRVYDKKGKVVKELKFENGQQIIEGVNAGTFSPK